MNIYKTYKKAKEVVNSCDDLRQIKGAQKYVNFWFRTYTSGENNKLRYADKDVVALYEKLKSLLYLKKYQLKKYID